MITYKTAKNDDEKIRFAELALSNRLFVKESWNLTKTLRNFINEAFTGPINQIVIAFDDDQPIGVVTLAPQYFGDKKSSKHISFYVKADYRRQGIGSELYSRILQATPNDLMICAFEGISGSKSFFNKNGIKVL